MTRTHTLSPVALLLAGLAVMPAQANLQPWYLGFGLGQSNYAGVCPKTYGQTTDCDDTDFAYDLFAGYLFNDYVGLELGYDNLGEANWQSTQTGRRTEADGISLGLVGNYPLTERFDINAEVGGYWYTLEITPEQAPSQDDDDVSPYYGVGFAYHLTDNLKLAAKYRHYHEMEISNRFNTVSADYYGLELSYRFGKQQQARSMTPPPPPPPAPAPALAPEPQPPVVASVVAPSLPAAEAVYFGLDSDTLEQDEAGKLDTIGEFLSQYPDFTATIVGHADKSGNVDYNQRLGIRRANAVADYFAERWQIDSQRMQVDSQGADNAAAAVNRPDRKVVIRIDDK